MIEEVRKVTMKVEFSFDTLLALISCITGVVALFVGGSAHKKINNYKKSFNDKKKFADNGVDNSKKAGRDIIEYSCDANALATLNAANFKASLEQVCDVLEKKTDDNLRRIIEKTNQIIQDNKIELGSYTKIDWINVYLENAKTSSDEYMQNVWAKVLAQELSNPDSFSYKSLDILKNMTSEDFKLFEVLCSVNIDSSLFWSDAKDLYKEYGLIWVKILKLQELGLLHLEASERTYTIEKKSKTSASYGNEYIIVFNNDSDNDIDYKIAVYLFTYSAVELTKVANADIKEDFVVKIAKIFKEKKYNGLNITLHRTAWNNGRKIYELRDLLNTENN